MSQTTDIQNGEHFQAKENQQFDNVRVRWGGSFTSADGVLIKGTLEATQGAGDVNLVSGTTVQGDVSYISSGGDFTLADGAKSGSILVKNMGNPVRISGIVNGSITITATKGMISIKGAKASGDLTISEYSGGLEIVDSTFANVSITMSELTPIPWPLKKVHPNLTRVSGHSLTLKQLTGLLKVIDSKFEAVTKQFNHPPVEGI